MKQHLKFIIILIFAFLHHGNIFSQSNISDNELKPFKIIFFYGDESIQKHEINIFRESNQYFAEDINPYYYYGTDSIWKIKLDKKNISICKKFIKIAHSLKENCPKTSSAFSEYQIISSLDTLKIIGDCDWKNLNYFNFQRTLFKNKFIELEKKRRNIVDNLEKEITGKWYYEPLKNKPKKGDYIKLTRIKPSDSNCYWEFSKKNYFKSSCNNTIDLTYSKDYEWYVDGNINLRISGGMITAKDGSVTVGNYDQSFILKSLNEKELQLEFSWVY